MIAIAAIAPDHAGTLCLGSISQHIPWRCRADLRHFFLATKGKDCIVGARTLATLTGLTPNARKWVTVHREGPTVEDLAAAYPSAWVIGGAYTYGLFARFLTRLIITTLTPTAADWPPITDPIAAPAWMTHPEVHGFRFVGGHCLDEAKGDSHKGIVRMYDWVRS